MSPGVCILAAKQAKAHLASITNKGWKNLEIPEKLGNSRVATALSPAGFIGSIMSLGLSVSVSLPSLTSVFLYVNVIVGHTLTSNSRLTASARHCHSRDALFPYDFSKSPGTE